MKKRLISVLLACVLLPIFLSSPAAAISTRASAQIARYSTNAKAIDGKIAVGFSIGGTRRMNSIGAEEILIYAQVGSRWVLEESFDQDDAGMSRSDANAYANTIYYSGTSGTYYKIVVTVFAEDSSGSDSRTETHYVTL